MKLLEKQNEVAEAITRDVLGWSPNEFAVHNIAGAVGAGKTSLLRLVGEKIKAENKIPIFLSSPNTDADTGCILLSQIYDSLQANGILNGQAQVVDDPKRKWKDKFELLTAAVDAASEDVVVLCDEPSYWFNRHQAANLTDTPDHQVKMLADWVLKRAECRRIVTGGVPSESIQSGDRTFAPRVPDGSELLDDKTNWFSLGNLAGELKEILRRNLDNRSAMSLELLVGIASLKGPSAIRELREESENKNLLKEFLTTLEQKESPICKSLSRLAVARHAISKDVFNELTSGLNENQRDVIRACLSDETPDSIELHPLVRHEVLRRSFDRRMIDVRDFWRLSKTEVANTHKQLFDLFKAKETARLDIESFYHGTLCEKLPTDNNSEKLRFIEQLHEVGRSLSYTKHKHESAAKVFKFAVQLDDSNAYSHHYYAFNLDWDAVEPEKVEQHYLRAIELQPEHPWWWSRWIAYLVTRGRQKEAREEWSRAHDEMSISEQSPDWIYLSLHRWVARWMLHWSNLKMAKSVLNSIPSSVANDPSIQTLFDLYRALRHAENGVAVFPLSVREEKWWNGPHTGLPISLGEFNRQRWSPGRVIAKTENAIEVQIGLWPTVEQPELRTKDMLFQRDQIDGSFIECFWDEVVEDSFIEIAYYGGDGSKMRVGLHRETEWWDQNLLPLRPSPDRWYDKAVKDSWQETTKGR